MITRGVQKQGMPKQKSLMNKKKLYMSQVRGKKKYGKAAKELNREECKCVVHDTQKL